MWELDCEESWALKNWYFWTVLLEKTIESPLDCKEIQPVHPKGNQSCVFIGRTDVEAETPILWPPHAKSWLIGKDSDAGRDWGQEEKGMIEDEMAGWHHWLDGCASGWTLGVGDGQGGLACCDSWGHKESDTTERLNWTELKLSVHRLQKHQKEMCGESLFCWNEQKSTASSFIHEQKTAGPGSQWMCLHCCASTCETWWKVIFTSSPDESGEREMCLDYILHVWLYWKEYTGLPWWLSG